MSDKKLKALEVDGVQFENLEEADQASLHSLHHHMNLIGDVQKKLAEQASRPSLSNCEECGDDIPEARQRAVPGVRLCIWCQELNEKRK